MTPPPGVPAKLEHFIGGAHAASAGGATFDVADPVTDVIFTETNPAAAKWVLAQSGLIGSGYVRPPLVPLTEPGQAKVRELLRQGSAVLDGPVARMAEATARSGE